MKKMISIFCLLLSFTAFAQDDWFAALEHNGGNGGDDDEIMIKNTILQIGMFLDSSDGQTLFSKDLDSKKFLEVVKKVDIRVVDQALTDKFGLKRCALNFPEKLLVVFNRSCLDNLRNNVNDLYVLLTHEVLNLMGLELPDEKAGSVYPISTRIGALGPLVMARSKDVVFSSHCKLEVYNDFKFNWKVPKMIQNIIKDKGYSIQSDVFDDKEKLVLIMTLLTQKYDKYSIIGNTIEFEDGKSAHIESSFLKNTFNGLIRMSVNNGKAVFAPTPVSIQTSGQQYQAHVRGFWKESIIEAFMKLPACVKY